MVPLLQKKLGNMLMLIEQISNRIILLKYETSKDAAVAFLRFQEHYESPNPHFKGGVFTVGEYYDWYSQENGSATYYDDWSGFNIPSYVLKPFVQGLFDPLTAYEQEIVNHFKYRTDKFYLIGVGMNSTEDTIDHEVCHGLYYTCDEYREAVQQALSDYDLSDLEDYLLSIGYCEDVLLDEVHAYISASRDYLEGNEFEIDDDLHKNLRQLKKKYE